MPREILVPIDVEFRSGRSMQRERDRLARLEESIQRKVTDIERGQTVLWGKVHVLSRQELRRTRREIARAREDLQRGVGGMFAAVNKYPTGEIQPVTQLLPNSIMEQERVKWQNSRKIKPPTSSQPSR